MLIESSSSNSPSDSICCSLEEVFNFDGCGVVLKTKQNFDHENRISRERERLTDENLDAIDIHTKIMNNIDIYHMKTLVHVHVRISYEF